MTTTTMLRSIPQRWWTRARLSLVSRDAAVARPPAVARMYAAGAAVLTVVCTAMLIALHFLPGSAALSALSQPLSDYALQSDGILFNIAVLLLATGLGALQLALRREQQVGPVMRSALSVCGLGLVSLVIWPDRTGPSGLTTIGWVHWSASMAAFGSLPLVLIGIWRAHRASPACLQWARVCGAAGIAAYGWFALFFVGNILAFTTGIPLWRVGGLVERILALTEIGGAAALVLWTWRGCHCAAPDPGAAPNSRASTAASAWSATV